MMTFEFVLGLIVTLAWPVSLVVCVVILKSALRGSEKKEDR